MPAVPARIFALELDVLRGIAAILMIANHVGVQLLPPNMPAGSAGAVAVFVGAFAPVVFFFATGFGLALRTSQAGRPAGIAPLLWKALLLVVADQFFFWQRGIAWGLDFFSFIALASVVVTLVARRRRPEQVCVGLIFVLMTMRYGLGPALRLQLHLGGLVDWLVGVHGVANVSYPLSPWMVFPLLGFVVGRQYEAAGRQSALRRERWLRHGLVVMVGLFGATLLLAVLKSSFFRWGTVSFAFFVLALGVVLGAGLLSVRLTMSRPSLARAVALRGVASFAVIPLHYALVDASAALLPTPVEFWTYAVLSIVIAAISFRAAASISAWVSSTGFARRRRFLMPALLLLVGVAAAPLVLTKQAPASAAVLVLVGQLGVAAMLGVRAGKAVPAHLSDSVPRTPAL